jgi:hypothetical protein
MDYVLEKEELYIFIPEIEEKAENVKEKQKEIKKKLKHRNHDKKHQKKIDIIKVNNQIDSSILGVNYYNL